MRGQRDKRGEGLNDFFLAAPGDYTHANFETSSTTSIQGLVWMPTDCFLMAHVACAVQLFAVGVAQFTVGLIVLDYDNIRSTNGHQCGATTTAASVFSIIAGIFSINVWRLFQPKADITGKVKPVAPLISKLEESSCSADPRRHSLVAVLIALPMCIAAAVIDGAECVTPLTDLDECTSTIFTNPSGGTTYIGCSVTGVDGDPSAACACISPSASGWECTYLYKDLPAALSIGGTSGCDHLPAQLSSWLQISTILSSVGALLLVVVVALGMLNAISSPSCFRAVVLARHEESSFDNAGDDFSLEFHNRSRSASRSSRGGVPGPF